MNALDPERALIGVILNRPKLIRDVEEVEAADFGSPRLGALWGLMLWLDANRMPAEPVTVSQHLSRIDIPIGPTLITDLYGEAPAGGLARLYAKQVTNRAILRRLHEASVRGAQLTEDGTGDAQEIQEEIRAQVDKASRAIAEITTVDETIDAAIEELEAETPNSVPTPWPDLNRLIGGWRPGALYIVGARPAIGKSILAKQAAVALAETGWVAFHSLEMPRGEVDKRILAELAEVSLSRMDTRTMSERDWHHIASARARIGALKLSVDDRSSVRVIDIRSYARTLARRGPLAAIVVDYLQLMSAASGDRRQRYEIVGEWSRQLKELAKEMSIPVIALAQLNRGPEQRANPMPTMSDLRESGSLEQDADVVLLLHVDEDKDPSSMMLAVAKNRHGVPGAFQLERRGDIARLDPPRWRPSLAAGAAS